MQQSESEDIQIGQVQLQQLKYSLLDITSQSDFSESKLHNKLSNSFYERFRAKKNVQQIRQESNKQIDVLQASDYLKLLAHQKKSLSDKKASKIRSMNESLQLQQEDYKHLFMVVTQAHYLKLNNPGYYSLILSQKDSYPKNMFNGIEKDIPRTLMNGHPLQSSLRNVLIGYAIRNPTLLYCQGLNYVVAYLLINDISQECTFWILTGLIENVLPDDFFKDLSTISITTQIFSDVFPYIFPEMAKQMKEVGMDYSLFLVSWYVCLFTKGFINSVSAYLLTRLVLDSREHSFGYLLLKFSLGIIATILGRDQPFTFRPQFNAFRDKLEISVYEISLMQIKMGIQYIELNEDNYLKLQNYYREKRQVRHIETLEKDLLKKKYTLPTCNTDYPVCLHRVEIQRKLGNVEEVQIMKNNYDVQSQYIDNYFVGRINKHPAPITLESADQCLMARIGHICQQNENNMNLQSKLTPRISLRNDQSFILSQKNIKLQEQGSCSVEIKRRLSKMESKYVELSQYFIIDEKFGFGEEQVLEYQEFSQKEPEKREENRIYFNLEQQLQKHNIVQEWKAKQDQFVEFKLPKQPSSQTQKKQQQFPSQVNRKKKEDKRQYSKKTNLPVGGINNWRNYFGNTLRKVLKIKSQQLQ